MSYSLYSAGSPISGALATKLTVSSGIVNINTAITAAHEVIEFSLRSSVDTSTNFAEKAVKVNIGCYSPTTMTGTVDIPTNHSYFKSSSENGESIKFLVYPISDPHFAALKLTSVLKWASDITGCAANTVTEVTAAGAAVTGVQGHSIVNGTSGATGLFDPYLIVSFATPVVDKIIYLKGAGSTKYNLGDG